MTAKRQAQHEKRYRKNFYHYIEQELKQNSESKQPSAASQGTVSETLRNCYSSPPAAQPDTSWWIPYDQPTVPMNSNPVRPLDIRKIISRKRNFSAPGPDGIQPIMLKKLPAVQHILATVFTRIMETGSVPKTWQKGRMVFIFKKGDPENIMNYRPITLTSVISKVFHSILNTRLCE